MLSCKLGNSLGLVSLEASDEVGALEVPKFRQLLNSQNHAIMPRDPQQQTRIQIKVTAPKREQTRKKLDQNSNFPQGHHVHRSVALADVGKDQATVGFRLTLWVVLGQVKRCFFDEARALLEELSDVLLVLQG